MKTVEQKQSNGNYVLTDKSNCFKHSPATAKHNARRDQLIRTGKEVRTP